MVYRSNLICCLKNSPKKSLILKALLGEQGSRQMKGFGGSRFSRFLLTQFLRDLLKGFVAMPVAMSIVYVV